MAMSTLRNLYTTDVGKNHKTIYSELINENFTPECASEVIIRNIPQNATEYELFWFLERVGTLFRLRIMMFEDGSRNRGFGYAVYATAAGAKRAVEDLNAVPFRASYHLKIAISANECRLFVGSIPSGKTREEIWCELVANGVHNLVNVLINKSMFEANENRGYVFIEFKTRQEAIDCRGAFYQNLNLWNEPVIVDWPLRAHHAERFRLKSVPHPPVNYSFGLTKFTEKLIYTMASNHGTVTATSLRFEDILRFGPTSSLEGNCFPLRANAPRCPCVGHNPSIAYLMRPEEPSRSLDLQLFYKSVPLYYYPFQSAVLRPHQTEVEWPIISYQRMAAMCRAINVSLEAGSSNQDTEPLVRFRPY